MNKRKLKHVADITRRQFRRRVDATVMETMNKMGYMTNCESKSNTFPLQ